MTILGLHYGHDGAACIVKDGRIVVAIASERITRQKKSGGVTHEVLDYLFNAADMSIDDIDAIALTDWYSGWSHGTLECRVRDDLRFGAPETNATIPEGELIPDSWDRIFDDEVWEMDCHIRGRVIPGYNVGHHKAHCASVFYTSPFEEAWCMSMDSSGGKLKNNFMIARGRGNQLLWHDSPICMVGVAYGQTCNKLGIGHELHKAGAMMALAAYGKVNEGVRASIDAFKRAAFFDEGGDYHKWLCELWQELSGGRQFTKETSDCEQARDIAATMQFIFEQTILHAATATKWRDGCGNLCLSGGSFLNCNANALLARESGFRNVHHFPGCGDDGLAVGSALYVAHAIFNEPRAKYEPQDVCYLGPDRPGKEPDYEKVAQAIADGKVVGWFNGRSEYGPRALGNRSILADPRDPLMRDKINSQVKHREWYRPLSPSVLQESSQDWFDFPNASPFMLYTARCKRVEEVPAVVHVDGSARMQTVTAESNPRYYKLISAFLKLTGVPMVLNTSLNVDGQPILETEQDAAEMWERGVLDMMVVNGEIWEN